MSRCLRSLYQSLWVMVLLDRQFPAWTFSPRNKKASRRLSVPVGGCAQASCRISYLFQEDYLLIDRRKSIFCFWMLDALCFLFCTKERSQSRVDHINPVRFALSRCVPPHHRELRKHTHGAFNSELIPTNRALLLGHCLSYRYTPKIPIANTCLGVAKWAHDAFRSIYARHGTANIRIEEALNWRFVSSKQLLEKDMVLGWTPTWNMI